MLRARGTATASVARRNFQKGLLLSSEGGIARGRTTQVWSALASEQTVCRLNFPDAGVTRGRSGRAVSSALFLTQELQSLGELQHVGPVILVSGDDRRDRYLALFHSCLVQLSLANGRFSYQVRAAAPRRDWQRASIPRVAGCRPLLSRSEN